jgi:putative ABC transport system permease protein
MRELGMLRAIGMSRKQVMKMIFQEALFQGGFGAVAAIALGGWFSYSWIKYSFSHLMGYLVHYYFPWSSVLTTLLTGLFVATIAGVFPARKAAQMEISEALDYE